MPRTRIRPDTTYFHYFNANPHGRITCDCVVRALATATQIPYDTVVDELTAQFHETGIHQADSRAVALWLKRKGWKQCSQPKRRDGTKYTGRQFCWSMQNGGRFRAMSNERVVANIGAHHVVAIVEGKVNDTWNSTGRCIGKYWRKPQN